MNPFSPWHIALIVVTFFLAGGVKGVTGMGLPTVAMGLLGVVMSPLAAASLLVMPSFVTNCWQLFSGPNFRSLLKRLWLMMLGIVVGTVAGASVLTRMHTRWTSVALGVALLVYALYTLLARPLEVPARFEPALSPVIGMLTGLITGATGVFVIPAVPYLQALGLSKENLIQALGLSFTVSTVALAVGLTRGGAFHVENLTLSAVALLPALVGMWVGTRVRHRISAVTFRRGFLIFLAVLGLELILRPLL